jgi:hypothetical protein
MAADMTLRIEHPNDPDSTLSYSEQKTVPHWVGHNFVLLLFSLYTYLNHLGHKLLISMEHRPSATYLL